MAFRYDIRLSGSGGQGLILMGLILAEAIGIHDGKYVALTQSYGPEARGGYSKAEIVVSDREIDYPKAMKLDLLVCLTQQACEAYYLDLKPEGLLVVDSTLVTQIPAARVYGIPFTRIAREKLGKEMAANIVALGALAKLTPIVTPRSLERALLTKGPKGSEALNQKALMAGMAAARQALKNPRPQTNNDWSNEDA
jgi:2-oxoglutarate ferredoxin oxidoreductase subunit gamma